MPTHVALLRGVNVGGRSRVAMAELRQVVTALGHVDVATYVQSGNVVFSTQAADTDEIAAALASAIADALDVSPEVVVLTREELARVVADNPFPDETNPRHLHAVFRGDDPGPGLRADVTAAQHRAQERGSRDEARVVGRTLYLRTPDGFGRSDLVAALTRTGGRAAGSSGTARNWATVTKLLALLEG